MTADVALAVADLRTHFFTRAGVVKAVDGVSFTLRGGEVLGLVGESGSGKSITGFSILGLVDDPGRIVGGSIRYRGRELVGLRAAELRAVRGREIAMVFQDPMMTLNPMLAIGRQMDLALAAHGGRPAAARRARSVEILGRLGIPEPARRLAAYPHELSGGMRQRVAIACALLNRPSVIIADEPTTALDVSIQAQILREMTDLVRDTGVAMIWISHDLAVVSSVAQRVAVMYAGRIVEDGPVTAVLRGPRHPYTRGLLDSLPAQGRPGEPLAQIPGTTPSLLTRPAGCPFHPRCGRATEPCRTAEPERRADGEHGFRCHNPLPEAAP
ncbi:Dipeptide transport ATP-binding protein DppD [Methylobacterium crusticola]|uniref:Dipeptide transport ATP-binding protein DppD n=1 Tax=Methylobacterium crusticola TaxID=1697972 RepID=A0ABQ4QSG8_9HYPH|nr:ABC transporter ATP-binding protein [Methylobacterium crusticola]GJD48258.1 Dipeptide transport ATP-binding protein DppD [Methylobacterium crusticola]